MTSYQINDLERLTGIKAHTLRIWEKRYGLITPHRTPTNIRYYDDEQVRKLLNVATLLELGHKISEIAKFTDKDISARIQQNNTTPDDSIITTLINDLVGATVTFDELYFEKSFSSAVTRLGMYRAMTDVMYPFLSKVGILWSINNIVSAQEHFATHIVRRKLVAAIDGLPPAKKKNKKFLLFLPPDEWHELALLFSDYVIKSAGYSTIYLGPNLPYKIIDVAVNETKPTHLLTFFISRRDVNDIRRDMTNMVKKHNSVQVLLSGSPDVVSPIKFPKETIVLPSPADLQKLL